MSLFRCSKCGCYENTATSNYHLRRFDLENDKILKGDELPPPLCSGCDPAIGSWHGHFPQKSADGMIVGDDGYLYHEVEFTKGQVWHCDGVARIVDGVAVPLTTKFKAGRPKTTRKKRS